MIIQSGLDIPNVNTLVIRNAEKLGLAQMYQLRGRIGRSIRKAYCYFFYNGPLKGAAKKRLEFLQEFGELSSGFRLAMRDLELRGAGNLFGHQQHGYIKQVGTELYFKLLEEAVSRSQGLNIRQPCSIKFIKGGRFFPEYYVSSADERFRLHVRLSRIKHINQLNEISKSNRDSYINQSLREVLEEEKVLEAEDE